MNNRVSGPYLTVRDRIPCQRCAPTQAALGADESSDDSGAASDGAMAGDSEDDGPEAPASGAGGLWAELDDAEDDGVLQAYEGASILWAYDRQTVGWLQGRWRQTHKGAWGAPRSVDTTFRVAHKQSGRVLVGH
jgi:hypothetical protein